MTDKSVGKQGSKKKYLWGLFPLLIISFISWLAKNVFEFEPHNIAIFVLFGLAFYLGMKNDELKLEIGYLSDRVDHLEEDLQNQIRGTE